MSEPIKRLIVVNDLLCKQWSMGILNTGGKREFQVVCIPKPR
ncbi:MAG: hypothetical protein AAFX46_19480 [Cyanobacteria bacterium J06636_27]